MRRREFIAMVGGAVTWPVAVRAQQTTMPVVGFLRSASLTEVPHFATAFRQGLKETGFVEGQNVAVEYHSADDNSARLVALAADLIRRRVDVIVGNHNAALAAKSATTTIPIVFATGSDPVRDGLVANLNRPRSNVTGVVNFSSVLGAKRLELLRKLVPEAKTIGVLVHASSTNTAAEQRDVQAGAKAIGQQIVVFDVSSEGDLERAFATFLQHGVGAVLVGAGAFMTSNRKRVVALAARHRLPTSYASREAVLDNGLMSYGSSFIDAYHQVGIYTGRILKGEKPADLPVMQSTKVEFVLNIKTAKTLGLEVPPTVLALADEVIE